MFEIVELGPNHLAVAAALLERAMPGRGAGEVAAEKMFAVGSGEPRTLAAQADGVLLGIVVVSAGYLRILAVDPAHRGCGVGTALLDVAVGIARESGCERLIAAAEPGNYLTPGVPESDADTIRWLGQRGFDVVGTAVNLEISVAGNRRVSGDHFTDLVEAAAEHGYRIDRAAAGDAAELEAKIGADFGRPWWVEVDRALVAPSGVFVARDRDEKLAGFAAHDGNNRGLGWFGPAATWPDHRGRGLGAALLCACLVDVAAAGHARCTVGWIGPRDFYQRVAGLAGEERFARMQRAIRQ